MTTFYHASPHDFDMPDYDAMCANRTNHENGLLGLWVSNKSDWIASFGKFIYQMEIHGTTQDISVEELRSIGKDPESFINMRAELLRKGCDVLRLVELNGQSEMRIVINFSAIQKFTKVMKLAPKSSFSI